jgi:hypothetical protein
MGLEPIKATAKNAWATFNIIPLRIIRLPGGGVKNGSFYCTAIPAECQIGGVLYIESHPAQQAASAVSIFCTLCNMTYMCFTIIVTATALVILNKYI